ncbi:hypothetical protein HN358_02230 [Candidatus Uhrbacteria bacterium]|jgi:hypothetical protein|nr:hypothetical protein [Candidatus Uhrbacteria bacterium]MBT7717497.1 hypothetical protein [Candidatus Uhrbacteria bacterium]
MSNPEYKEKIEKYREKQMLNPDLEGKIRDKIAAADKYSDNVYCPNSGCGVPVQIIDEPEVIILKCSMCGFERIIGKKKV